MRAIIVLILIFLVNSSFAQNTAANLNGKIFMGTATELTTPETDRLPMNYDDVIRFENGNVYSNLLSKYFANDCRYFSEIDDRRMIALQVVKFNASGFGIIHGKEVTVEFSGEIIGDKKLNGNYIIKYADNSKIEFNVIAESE